MSRGSISSWQDYGRRSSQIMPQFHGSPVEFMACDDIEYKRDDGWFLSYSKIAAIIVVFIIGIVAAGSLGWYINSLPKKKSYDTIDLLSDDIEDEIDTIDEILISPFVYPLKYQLELTPIININGPSRLNGHIAIEFYVNDTTGLTILSLNAKNITVSNYKLSLLNPEEDKTRLRRRQRRRADDETNYQRHHDDTTLERDVTFTPTENETFLYKQDAEYPLENVSFVEASKGSSAKHSSFNKTEINLSEIEVTRYETDENNEIHTLYLGSPIQEGIYSLEIAYEAGIDDNAFFVANYSGSGEEKWLLGTKLKRSDARYLFPVFEDADYKSVFSVSIVRSTEMRALSNMPLMVTNDTPNATMVSDTFDESPPLSPHNLAFLMGHIEDGGVTFLGDSKVVATFWSDSSIRSLGIYLYDKLNPAVINLIDVFPIPYSLPKLDLVCLPPGIDESVARPGLIAIKQSAFYTTERSPLVTKENALKVLVVLFGQQLLDEFVNANRTDAWICKASLLYFHHEVVPKIDSSLNLSNSFVTDVQLQAMESDGYSISRPFHENVNYRLLHSFNDEYAKGACLIRMLHGAISDTALRNGYKKLITRWKSNATYVADFMNAMAEETTDLPLTAGVTLEEAMNSWISQGGYPVITVIRNYEKGTATIYQEQFSLDRPLENISRFWYIPLSYIDENGNWSSPTITWFQSEPKFAIDNVASNESWVLFNINKTGYYRVHYDERNWMLLNIALQENHDLFPPETRASLIDDVFSLAAIGLIKYEIVFDFIKYMQMKERHYVPWMALMRHVFKLNRLLYETPIFTDFQEFMVKFVSPLYSEVSSKLAEGSHLTMIAVKIACMFEHTKCLDWAKGVFENAKTDNDIRELIPSYMRETFYCTLARYGTRKEWNYYMEQVTLIEDEEERKHLLSSFACFQAPWILQNILNEILHEGTFHQGEISVILKAFPRNPAAAQAASRFVRANWQDIAQRFAGSYGVMKSFVLSMSNGLTTEQDLEDLQLFRENNYDSTKGARYAAALVEANGNFVTSWLKNSLPEIEKLLKGDAIDKASAL
ncbi:thyrotropin-releasing hormone-degrading ectoenzyme-like isoform X2 [Hylaeus volcanicus]|uniref:thyrotropin-releasing hormone-degrading ectoenzyme-like isoform X2 n=1 Tax=Hylaeus volcanicus TaxID=313075 RepID=UPI0023B820AB|nr:thyrotropin-releasing hormone-degrading ectoenzyme-like isoform X2 [Hylaeus volcanicus]